MFIEIDNIIINKGDITSITTTNLREDYHGYNREIIIKYGDNEEYIMDFGAVKEFSCSNAGNEDYPCSMDECRDDGLQAIDNSCEVCELDILAKKLVKEKLNKVVMENYIKIKKVLCITEIKYEKNVDASIEENGCIDVYTH